MDDETDAKAQRRRGAALEAAILDAAWAELEAHGYDHLTLEGVAKRAGTSRPVLNRRWGTRLALVSAAITRFASQNPITVPDMGNLRDELLLLLHKTVERSSPRLVRLIYEMQRELEASSSSFADMRSKAGATGYPTQQILDRAIARGDVEPGRMRPRLISLPIDLVRHQMIITLQAPSAADIAEIIDDIVLPLWVGPPRLRSPARSEAEA